MATVQIGKVGQTLREVEADNVQEAIERFDSSLGDATFKVKINGQSADMGDALSDGDFVSIGEKVKGGSL